MIPGTNVYIRARVVCPDPRDATRWIVTPLDGDKKPSDGVWLYCPEHAIVKVATLLKDVVK